MDITQSPYFFFGSTSDTRLKQYALYETVTERFIICDTEPDILRTLQILLSARYITQMVELSTAKNWNKSQIDNSCCYDWKLANHELLVGVTQLGSHWLADVHPAQELEPSIPLANDECLVQDNEFILLATEIVRNYEDLDAHGIDAFVRSVEERAISLTGIDLPVKRKPTNEDKKRVYSAIYKSHNIQELEACLKK